MIRYYTKTGSLHTQAGEANQDFLCFSEAGDHLFAAVADGVSACPNSADGARIACTEAVAYLERHSDSIIQFPAEKTAYLLLEQIRSKLTGEARSREQTPESYASTLSVFHLDKRSRRIWFYLLGDSPALVITREACTPAAPLPRLTQTLCPSTMTAGAYKAMQITTMDLEGSATVFLCTDGVIRACNDSFAGKPMIQAIRRADIPALADHLDQYDAQDDCSFLSVSIPMGK